METVSPTRRKPYTERVVFIFAKRLALRALREEAARDPENLVMPEMTKRLASVKTQTELDELLTVYDADDQWLEMYIRERSVELITALVEGGTP